MKKTIRILTLCIALLMLVSVFAACNKNKGDDNSETKDETPSSDTYRTFNGYEFVVATEISDYQTHEFDFDGESVGTVEAALFNRNAYIEEMLDIVITGVEIEQKDRDDIIIKLREGDCPYDLIFGMGQWWLYAMAPSDLLVDMASLSTMDLTAPCWDQNAVSDLSVYGVQYALTGDLHCGALDCTSMMLLNRDVLALYPELDDPTDYVLNDTWTYEVYFEMIKQASQQLVADDIMDEKDQFGISTTSAYYTNLVISSGEAFYAKNSDGMLEMAMGTSLVEKIDKILSYADPAYAFVKNSSGEKGGDEPYRKVFNEGRALFMGGIMGDLVHPALKDSAQDEVSPIPFPKYDLDQDRYYATVNFQAMLMMMPKTDRDFEDVGYITQTICEASTEMVRAEYYDIILKARSVVDEFDSEVVDVIYNSRSYDLGTIWTYERFQLRTKFNEACTGGSIDIASFIETNKRDAEKFIEKEFGLIKEKLDGAAA